MLDGGWLINFAQRDAPDPSRCLGVFNLSMYTTEKDLREMFNEFGEIEKVGNLFFINQWVLKVYLQIILVLRSTSSTIIRLVALVDSDSSTSKDSTMQLQQETSWMELR